MKYLFSAAVFLGCIYTASAQEIMGTLTVSEDIRLLQLTEDIFLHVSEADFGRFGRVSSNGLVILDGMNAILVDTPANDLQTEALVEYISDSLGSRTILLIGTHWHDDCIGGIDFLHGYGARSVALDMTVDLAAEHGMTPPREKFSGRWELEAAGKRIVCLWPGGGHTPDNIVVWIPEDRILFGGCLIKDLASRNLGNTADADVEAWPQTLRTVIELFPDARTVIPGHGKIGDMSLVGHTLKLLD